MDAWVRAWTLGCALEQTRACPDALVRDDDEEAGRLQPRARVSICASAACAREAASLCLRVAQNYARGSWLNQPCHVSTRTGSTVDLCRTFVLL
eukprot:5636125-Pleurochrysis_carterae.AAC.1